MAYDAYRILTVAPPIPVVETPRSPVAAGAAEILVEGHVSPATFTQVPLRIPLNVYVIPQIPVPTRSYPDTYKEKAQVGVSSS